MISVTATPLLSSFAAVLVHLLGRRHRTRGGSWCRSRSRRGDPGATRRARPPVLGEPEERDAVDARCPCRGRSADRARPAARASSRASCRARRVPSDGLGHVAAHKGEMVEAPQLELGVVVRGASHGIPQTSACSHCIPSVRNGSSNEGVWGGRHFPGTERLGVARASTHRGRRHARCRGRQGVHDRDRRRIGRPQSLGAHGRGSAHQRADRPGQGLHRGRLRHPDRGLARLHQGRSAPGGGRDGGNRPPRDLRRRLPDHRRARAWSAGSA